MEIGKCSAAFSVPFHPLPSLPMGKPFLILGGVVGKEKEKSRRKKLGEWKKGRTEETQRRAVPRSSAQASDEGQAFYKYD